MEDKRLPNKEIQAPKKRPSIFPFKIINKLDGTGNSVSRERKPKLSKVYVKRDFSELRLVTIQFSMSSNNKKTVRRRTQQNKNIIKSRFMDFKAWLFSAAYYRKQLE